MFISSLEYSAGELGKENTNKEKKMIAWKNWVWFFSAAALFYSAFRSLELYDYNYIYIAHRHTTVAKWSKMFESAYP